MGVYFCLVCKHQIGRKKKKLKKETIFRNSGEFFSLFYLKYLKMFQILKVAIKNDKNNKNKTKKNIL